jgi:hypothetical protein
MKKLNHLLLSSLIIIMVGCSTDSDTNTIEEHSFVITPEMMVNAKASKNGNTPSAHGQGTILVDENNNGFVDDETKRFLSFTVNTLPSGEVKGQGVIGTAGGEMLLKFNIDCINYLSIPGPRDAAVMSGTITHGAGTSTKIDTESLEGFKISFAVIEGGDVAPNGTSQALLTPNTNWSCFSPFLYPVYAIQNGNIIVNP